MDKIAVNAFIHGGALSDPIELNPNLARIFQEKSKENHWLIWYDNHKYTLQRNDNV